MCALHSPFFVACHMSECCTAMAPHSKADIAAAHLTCKTLERRFLLAAGGLLALSTSTRITTATQTSRLPSLPVAITPTWVPRLATMEAPKAAGMPVSHSAVVRQMVATIGCCLPLQVRRMSQVCTLTWLELGACCDNCSDSVSWRMAQTYANCVFSSRTHLQCA
jgi:hypothetical protein